MVTVANRIEEVLIERGKTRYWLAKKTDLSNRTVYKLIKEKIDIDEMKYKTVRLIASALNVEIEDLRANGN